MYLRCIGIPSLMLKEQIKTRIFIKKQKKKNINPNKKIELITFCQKLTNLQQL